MYYEKIQGWFTFDMLYKNMVDRAKENEIFVEIGTWKGQSACYMAEMIKNSNKNIKFYTIDSFEMTEDNDHFPLIDVPDLYTECCNNLSNVSEHVTIIRGKSHDVYTQFADNSINFLFIDGSHQYENVKKDIELWYPKIKISGFISGHDYFSPDVKKAVDEYFGRSIPYSHDCWLTIKKQ